MGAGSYAGMVLWVNDPMATHADESRRLWVYERMNLWPSALDRRRDRVPAVTEVNALSDEWVKAMDELARPRLGRKTRISGRQDSVLVDPGLL